MQQMLDWENRVLETKGGFISLWDMEYLSIARSIIRIMRIAIDHDTEFSLNMSTHRLLKNLNIGLSYYYSEKIYTPILFIDSVDLSFFHVGIYHADYIDYIVLEKEVRNLIKRTSPKYLGS